MPGLSGESNGSSHHEEPTQSKQLVNGSDLLCTYFPYYYAIVCVLIIYIVWFISHSATMQDNNALSTLMTEVEDHGPLAVQRER